MALPFVSMLNPADAPSIARRFGVGDADAVLSGPVARGELGQVWRLDTPTMSWAVKESFGPVASPDAGADMIYQEVMHASGIPLPRPVRTDDGGVLAEVGSATVRLYEWVDLELPDRRLDPAEVGRLIASIQSVVHLGSAPVHPWYTEPVGAERWDALIGELAAADAPFASRVAALRDELVALEDLFESPLDLQTCHRDLFADNVLRTQAGSLCVIDWENSGLADPSQELAVALFEFGCADLDRISDLYGAYIGSGGAGRIERPGQFTMAVAQLAHIGEAACRQWLDPTRGAERQRNQGRVEEFLDDPITGSLVESIMDAVA